MFSIVIWTIIFSIATVISILLTGSRTLISGDITFFRIIHILLDWRFILGAAFAFIARLSFIMINNALYKIPSLSNSSTTITTFITAVSMIFVVIANHYFLKEQLNNTQIFGAILIFIGIFFITKG